MKDVKLLARTEIEDKLKKIRDFSKEYIEEVTDMVLRYQKRWFDFFEKEDRVNMMKMNEFDEDTYLKVYGDMVIIGFISYFSFADEDLI